MLRLDFFFTLFAAADDYAMLPPRCHTLGDDVCQRGLLFFRCLFFFLPLYIMFTRYAIARRQLIYAIHYYEQHKDVMSSHRCRCC